VHLRTGRVADEEDAVRDPKIRPRLVGPGRIDATVSRPRSASGYVRLTASRIS
jgi:hypothetical protein